MAHECPACGQRCYCNGDIDDLLLNYDIDMEQCTHCLVGASDEDRDDWDMGDVSGKLSFPEFGNRESGTLGATFGGGRIGGPWCRVKGEQMEAKDISTEVCRYRFEMKIVPCDLSEANAFVAQHHRHHRPVIGHKFSIAVAIEDKICGVAIVGRPVSRMLDDGWSLEVTRLATNGTKNACSMLYAACWRTAKSMGYRRLLTYILESEPGTSLRAAGWKEIGRAGGGSWSRKSRPRVDKHPTQAKLHYEVNV